MERTAWHIYIFINGIKYYLVHNRSMGHSPLFKDLTSENFHRHAQSITEDSNMGKGFEFCLRLLKDIHKGKYQVTEGSTMVCTTWKKGPSKPSMGLQTTWV